MATEWQWRYLSRDFAEETTNAATIRLKLPKNEQISAIEVELEALRHTTGYDYDHTIYDIPEKLEVIADGSKVLYSMSPETAAFMHFATLKQVPRWRLQITGLAYNRIRIKILFGRGLRDEAYMLDTGQYNNVYLEIPWSLNTTYWTTHSLVHTIRYLRPIQRLSPVGFLRNRDIEYGAHVWTATGQYPVDLPMKYPWRMLGARIWDPDVDPANDITHIKLDIDDGRMVLVDDDIDDLLIVDTERLPYPIHTIFLHNHTTDSPPDYLHSLLGKWHGFSGSILGATSGHIMQEGPVGSRIGYWVETGTAAYVESRVNAIIHGGMYQSCVMVKDWMNGESFPVGEHSEAQLDFTHGAYTIDDLRIFLQEVCPLSI